MQICFFISSLFFMAGGMAASYEGKSILEGFLVKALSVVSFYMGMVFAATTIFVALGVQFE